ncbi:MAG: histidine kinase [Bacteroidales bacterium]
MRYKTAALLNMKTRPKFLTILLLSLISMNGLSQSKKLSAVICGRIIVNEDSISPLKPLSVILQKEWPITSKEFEQQGIDTDDYHFKIRMDLDQITYGRIIVNFFRDIDSTAKAKNGSWRSLEVPEGFIRRHYAARIYFSGFRFVVEPGDSVYVVVDYDKKDQVGRPSIFFSGKGGANNNLLRSEGLFDPYNRSFKLPLDEGLKHEDRLMEDKLADLVEAKDSISQTCFNVLKTDILFDNLSTKHALIRASLYGSDIPVTRKRAIAREHYTYMDTLTLRPEYLKSADFRNFLDDYLEYLNRIITGKDIPYGDNENSYWLAKAVFDEEILKTFQYEQLAVQMETPFFFNKGTFQYEDFIKKFPDTPESLRLTRLYTKHFPVSNGQPAPELELVDSTGRKKDLSSLRGKVVIIASQQAWLNIRQYEQKIDRIKSLRNKFGDDLVIIANDLQYRASRPLSGYIDYYVTEDQTSQDYYAYKFLSSYRYNFIIGRNGVIHDCVYDLYIPEETISQLISEKYTILTRLKLTAGKHINEIVLVLSALILLTLILLLFSRLRQRRQELLKKQLNSELKAIRSQLNPHFLFNALNSIQNFINKSDAKTANQHLTKFSLLMRRIIELSEKDSITLKEELDFNKTYVELEQLRYGFKFKLDVDQSVDLYSTEIPSMIIQPFVENAIVHCMAELGAKGELRIFVNGDGDDKISIRIADNGKGFPTGTNKGFGLKSSRERIDLLNSQNKDQIDLKIESPADNQTGIGTTVILNIPKKY